MKTLILILLTATISYSQNTIVLEEPISPIVDVYLGINNSSMISDEMHMQRLALDKFFKFLTSERLGNIISVLLTGKCKKQDELLIELGKLFLMETLKAKGINYDNLGLNE